MKGDSIIQSLLVFLYIFRIRIGSNPPPCSGDMLGHRNGEGKKTQPQNKSS